MPNKKEKEGFQPLDIVYKPVKTIDLIIECYFTDQTNLAYCAHFQQGKDRFQSTKKASKTFKSLWKKAWNNI